MSTEYKPTLRFNALETQRIQFAAINAGMKTAEWMRKLILDHAPQLTIADPLAVRVAGFEERFGWNVIHCADALAHAGGSPGGRQRYCGLHGTLHDDCGRGGVDRR